MALTKIKTGSVSDSITLTAPTVNGGTHTSFTSTGIDDNATSTAITITSDENVGIGVSPSTTLDVYNGAGWGGVDIDGSAGGELRLQKSGTDYGGVYASDSHGLVIRAVNGVNSMQFLTNSVERMRIDNGGRVTMPYQPCFAAHAPQNTSGGGNSNGGTVSSGNLIFAASAFNNGSHYSTSNGRFTAPVTGHYYFSFSLLWDDSLNGTGYIALRKNNSLSLQYGYAYVADAGQYGYLQVSGGAVVQLNANEYVQIYSNLAGWHIGNESNWAGFLLG